MAVDAVRTWRIHLGAHKTATTHVQEMLARMQPQLRARGIDFVPNDVVRRTGLAKALATRRVATRVPFLRGRTVQGLMASHLDPHRQGGETMVLSEEKFLGGSQHVFATPIYPAADRIAPLLASLAGRADVALFLSIRSLDTQMPSAYVQELKFMPPLEGGFDRLKARVLAEPPSWFDLVRRIRRAAPHVPLRVWRQEDYRANTAEILNRLCGQDIGPLAEIEDPAWTRSPSLAAVQEAEALPQDMPQAERRARVLAIFEEGREGPRFEPFTAAERATLQAAYARDLERIDALGKDILMRF